MIGQLEQDHAIVLMGQGNIIIPDITLEWWDVDDNRQKRATLAGRIVSVSAPASTAINSDLNAGLAIRWSAGLAVLVLLALFCWWILKRKADANIHFNKAHLKSACVSGDAIKARALLIAWGRQQWPQASIIGLSDLVNRITDKEFRLALENLDSTLYAPGHPEWQGRLLWQRFMALKLRYKTKPVVRLNLLPNLYPRE
ncbi:MAG: hypothetical protein ACI9KN_000288 [Gammaproteobacteria bacterium]|jgi:hypothetical protein